MRTITTIGFILSAFVAKGQSGIPEWVHERLKKLDNRYLVSDYIHPQFLEADFSGDRKTDLAVLVEEKTTSKKGIAIFFRESDSVSVLGAGMDFGNGGDNFAWAAKWSVDNERTAYETTFNANGDVDGGRQVRLKRPAIKIREEEGSGGLIYYDGTKFIWIQQGD